MKSTIMVAFTVEHPDDINPDDLLLDIKVDDIGVGVMVGESQCLEWTRVNGRVIEFETQESVPFEEEEK